jgi:predicted DNA-binding protein (MmcQ/YjbR family)
MNRYPWLDSYLRALPGATSDYKAQWDWQRYQIGGKMFAAICQPGPKYAAYGNRPLITLKCDPDLALTLRQSHPDILPGFYTDKRCWNSIFLDGAVPDALLSDLCEHAYALVFAKLTKKLQKQILNESAGAGIGPTEAARMTQDMNLQKNI